MVVYHLFLSYHLFLGLNYANIGCGIWSRIRRLFLYLIIVDTYKENISVSNWYVLQSQYIYW